MKIELYETVEITIDVLTDSIPSVLVKKGTLGNVVDVVIKDNGERLYLVELDNDMYPDGVIESFSSDQIKKWVK